MTGEAYRPTVRSVAATAGRLVTVASLIAAIVFATAGPSAAAERKPILFQPVTEADATFVGTGTGPFTTRNKDGVKDDGKTVIRNKVVKDNFKRPYRWGSSAHPGGMVVHNASDDPICEITIKSLNDDTFPKDEKVYEAPQGWKVTVSDDGKTLTFSATKRPDDCISSGGWFWMKAPASPHDEEATLSGQLSHLAVPDLLTGDATTAVASETRSDDGNTAIALDPLPGDPARTMALA
jgi:hypothetical protein